MYPLKHIFPLLLVALAPLAGCGSGSAPALPVNQTQLRQIHAIYQLHIKNQEKPPSEVEDLARYEGVYPSTLKDLRDGKYIVVWDVKTKDSGTVLAYEKDVPTNGGTVVMADGAVKTMTADQFKRAKVTP
jgi:hypothetical protein